MRKLTDRERDLSKALSGTVKSALSIIPALGQAIAGWDAYKRSAFDRNIMNMITMLSNKVEDLGAFFKNEYFSTDEGQLFTRKSIDAALDTQYEDKQELFVNALINAPTNIDVEELTKLKYLDILRHLSKASLIVLAEIHKMYNSQVRGAGRNPDPVSPLPQIDSMNIARDLSDRYDPYLVTSSISELESQGLFSRTGEWRKDITTGRMMPGAGFNTAMCYTDFAAKFAEFITFERE